ncbi:MAG: metallophosphoesterase family protein, partial [Sphingobacteriales bacterium]
MPTTSMRAYEPLLQDDEYEDEHLMASQIECDIPFQELKEFIKEKQSMQSSLGKRFLLASDILEILVILCFAIIPSVLSSVNLISVALSMFLTLIFLLICGILIMRSFCPRELKNLVKVKHFKNFKRTRPQLFKELYCSFNLDPIKCYIIAGFIILYAFIVPLLTAKSCLAYYEPKTGTAYGAFYISTAFSRWISLPKVCPDGKICHIYSTLAEDASTSVILNVHTGVDVTTLEANYEIREKYEASKGGLSLKKTGLDVKIDLDSTGSRYMHSIYLDNLASATDYYVQFVYKGKVLGEANFTTFPTEEMEKNIVMVVGGDSSGNEVATAFIKELRNYNPDVILVGGDIVYDNGDQSCYYCWDYYLNQFDALNKHRNKLIPLILAFGNHDVGLDGGQLLSVDPYKNNLMLFFPQHSNFDVSSPGVPKPEDRM